MARGFRTIPAYYVSTGMPNIAIKEVRTPDQANLHCATWRIISGGRESSLAMVFE
jgi:hypothetical protein